MPDRLRAAAQSLLMTLMSFLAEHYVRINKYPMKLSVITEEQKPKSPELPFKAANQVEWLNTLYNNSPSTDDTTRQG